MAKNIMNLTNKVSKVAKESFEKANDKKVIWIKDVDLLDHPLNDEDISYTEDIEEHIKTEGFRHPITITTFGIKEEGKYYIVSGHRSRMAGRKLGRTEFPCIIEDYASETDVYHAILSGNTRRNRDPLDLANRYRKWDKYLDMIGFKGNRAEKIGTCLGISAKQAEKYKAFNKIIPEFWQLVREKNAAKDALYQLAPKTPEEQRDIYNFFFICCNPDSDRLTVTLENNIINAYRIGARSYEEYKEYINKKMYQKNKPNEQEPVKAVVSGPEKEEIAVLESEKKETDKEIENSRLDDTNSRVIHKIIEGKNDNQVANEELHHEAKLKYKEECLTKEDKEVAEKSVKEVNVLSQKDDNWKQIEKHIQVSETTEEHIKYINLLMEELSKNNEYDSVEEANAAIDKAINAAIKMLDIADKIRDENAAYDGWNRSYEKINKYMNKTDMQWN